MNAASVSALPCLGSRYSAASGRRASGLTEPVGGRLFDAKETLAPKRDRTHGPVHSEFRMSSDYLMFKRQRCIRYERIEDHELGVTQYFRLYSYCENTQVVDFD